MSDETLSRAASANIFLDRMRDSGARVKLSVLDRLLDDAPEMERDRPLSATDALTVLRRAVRRDLEALLNARRRFASIPSPYSELANSGFSFGLPDFTAGAMNEASAREVLRKEIERCIRQFEPRLVQVVVSLVPPKDELSTTLQFHIEALLHADPAPEPISFDTVVNAATADIEVSGGLVAHSLLPYFNQELVAVRQLAAEFAKAHPKIAGRLRLSPDAVDDPHVARLLDGVAFLSARAQQRLDDEFPELTDTLLGVLYPHYLAPFPSCAIAQFTAKPDLQAVVEIPSGFEVDTESVRGQSCRYGTASKLTLWPIRIESARLMGLPFTAPANPLANGATAVLRLVLTTLNPEVHFSALGMDRLRLFFCGSPATSLPLFELLAGHTLGVALADTPNDPAPVLLPKNAIEDVGFAPEDALLPWPARSFSGFRLLSEYFAFPQKFMFLDIAGLSAKTLLHDSNKLEIFIYLGRTSGELERAVSADVFALGCAPIVNLFRQRCEPVNLDHTNIEYRVLPDARRSGVMEVWGVTNVTEVRQDTTTRPWRAFYRLTETTPLPNGEGGSFHEIRRAAPASLGGTDTFLTTFDAGFDPAKKIDSVLSVEALCLNRDLPSELPFGGGHPVLKALKPHTGIANIACITPPTPTLRQEIHARGAWRLISHLSLGHLSVTGGAEGAAALKEVLRLYDLRDTADTRAALEALLAVNARPGTARVPGSRLGAFCRGLDVELEFEPRAFQGAGLYLLSSVLERFLALHATVNSFVRTTVKLRGKTEPEIRFPARAGARALL